MMNRLLIVFVLVVIATSCTSFPGLMPQPTSTVAPPTTAPLPTVAVADLLTQQINNDLSAYPRPACQAGTRNEKEWDGYGQGLGVALARLFSDVRAQSLALKSLVTIFDKASGLTLDVYESNTDALLVSMLNANCPQKIGGGASPYSPRDTVYVVNRHGGIWQIVQVANVLQAAWVEDHWNTLVTRTQWGNVQDFEVWQIRSSANAWQGEPKLKFSQLYGDPLPRLNSDGTTITLYSLPAACNMPKNFSAPYPTIESEYKWQSGQYQCVASRIIPTPTPTRRP